MKKLLPAISLILSFFASLSSEASTYYWVGNSGNWNDPQHWSIQPGGAGGAGVPGVNDDVVFDNYSFNKPRQTVVLPSVVNIRHFTWNTTQHKPTLSAFAPVNFEITGNYTVNGKFKNRITGQFIFNPSSDSHIKTNGVHFSADVVKKSDKKLTFDDDLYLEGSAKVVLEEGDIDFNQHHLRAYTIALVSSFTKSLIINNSILVLFEDFDETHPGLTIQNTGIRKLITGNRASCPPLTVTAVVTSNYNGEDVSCNDASDGTVCAVFSGGTAPYSITWLGSPGSNDTCYTNVDAGNYTVVIVDALGNVCSDDVDVTEPSLMTLFSATVTNPSCNGICDGSATPIIIGGTPPYSYLWSSGETTQTANQLCVGLNTLDVTDVNGCPYDTTFFILTPTPMTANITVTNASCFGICDGVAVSNPSGGNGSPFTWSWNGGPQASVDSAANLCAGNYTLHLEDNNGCGFDTSFTVTEPIPINIQLTNTVNLVCNGVCSGQLTVVASNGTPNYTYQWFTSGGVPLPGQTSDNATNLCAGTYYVVVTDANGCSQQSANFTLTQPPPITNTPSAQDVSCFGLCDGVLTISSAGGTPPHSYNWIDASNGQSVGTGTPLGGMCPGTYFAVITDGNGCIVNSSPLVTINEPPAIQLNVDSLDVSCFNVCDGGAIIVSSSGGTGPLAFTWFNSVPTQIGAGISIINQCAGSYSVTATDANGCTLNVPFTINEPNNFFIDLTTTDASCNGTCDGIATINLITGQTAPYIIDWSTSNNTGMIESNLCNGSFTVTITDANGCDTIHPFTINEPTTLTLSPAFADPSCSGICDGMASANPSGGTPGYTYVWQDSGGGFVVPANDTVTGLCPDTYTVTVTDANGCPASANYTITDPASMSATVTTTTSSCGVCDGSATVTIVGGTPSYSVVWFDLSGNTFGTNNPQSNLCAGTYYAMVTDSNNCSVLSDTVQLTDNVIITGSATGTNPSCFGFCDGTIDLTFAGGNPPFTFQWFDQAGNPIGQTTEDASGLCAGTYYVVITDSAGCQSPQISATLTEPPQLSATVTGQDATCSTSCDGQATVTASGGTPGYTYSWIDVATGTPLAQTTATVTGLCAGDYDVTVTDAGGCTFGPLTITINAPPAPTFTLVTTDALCFGGCDGTATATGSGGTPGYTFTWSTSANTTATENNLCAGTYTVSMTDANGCTVGPQNFTINEPTQLTAVTVDAALLCNGDCNASVSVTVNGGTTPYSYQWNDPGNQTTPVASGLCVGSYDVNITDANGCTLGPLTANVTEPTVVTFTTSSTDSDCNGNCNGTATANPLGGTPPYTYAWTDPLSQTTQTAISLCAGIYSVTVTDANGCSPASQNVTVNEPAVLSVTVTPTDVSCNALCDGVASATITGGTAPLTIIWDDPAAQTTAVATNLCAGTYTIDVTDVNGCTASATTTINEPTAITATTSSTLATCQQCDGTGTVTPSGGAGGYTYQWDVAAASQVTQTATSLCSGAYSVIVTDVAGCADTFVVAVSDLNGEVLTMDSTAASCFGICDGTATVSFTCGDPACTILWNTGSSANTISGLCAGTYSVTVTNNTGCSTVETVQITEPAVLDANATPTDVLCNGDCTGTGVSAPTGGDGNYSYQWDAAAGNQTTSTAFNLCPGSYDVTVTDGNGCTDTDNITVNEPTALTATTASADASCNGVCDGTGTAFPSGGVAPYTYIWDDPAAQTTQQATGLCAGQYNVTVTDANGCSFGPLQITINEPTAITVVTSNTSLDCNGDCDGTITATPSGGTSPYFYQWDDPLNQTTQTATNLCAGTYTVIVTDVNGCAAAPSTVTLGEPAAITSNFTVTDANCNGDCNGQIQSNVNGGTLPYTLQWNDPASTTTATVSNLCAGTYTLSVTDGAGCTASLTATVNEPAALQSGIASTDVSCNGSCDGSITTAASGGTAPYTYLWSPNGETTSAISNLCAGTYSVDITDANGCTVNDGTTISEPTVLTLTTSFAGSTCGNCDGSATVSPSGGQPSYTFQWDPAAASQTTQTALNLCAGVYSVIVTDAAGCSDTASVGVSDINAETVTLTITDESCFGACDGTATAVTACVDGPCSYQWYDGSSGLPIPGQTGTSMSNLCQDIYMIEVTNNSGCVTIVSDTLDQPTQILANPAITGLDCNGDCDGQITLVPSGGTGGYTFNWPSLGSSAATVTNLCAGSYIVDVSDNSGCTITDTIDITAPNALALTTSQTDPSCNGDCDGTITVNVAGGISPYTFVWDDPGTQTTQTATGLCDGTYSVIVTDDSLCTDTVSVTITEPSVLSATMSFTDATCDGDCDGTATATPAGGTSPYNYQWDDPSVQTTQTATALCAGTYNVIVGDANNCSTTLPVTISDPSTVTFTTTVTDILCNGSCNGSIVINAAGGTGSYSYSIDNGVTFQASNTFSALCAGSYDVVVMDSLGCLATPQNTTINEPSAITATTSSFPADCNVANGAATVVPSGGTPGYTYNWFDASLNPLGQTTPTAINLSAGIYVVDITDANGCVLQVAVTVSNVNAPTITGTTTDVSCNGDCTGAIDVTTSGGNPPYVFLWVPDGQTTEDISNLCAGGYLLQVTDTAGCINFQNFTINEPGSLNGSFTTTDATCGLCDGTATVTASGGTSPYIFDWSNGDVTATADSLCSGAYMVMITDASGCSNTFNVSINNTNGPTETISQTNASCFGMCDGSATVTPSGGTPPYTFYWIHDGSTTNSASNLCAGTYFLEITDSLGCIRVTNITITEPQQLTDSTVVTPATCGLCDGQLSVFMTGGTGPFSFQWDAAAGNATTSIVSSLCEGIYQVVPTDANGCSDTITLTVNGNNAPQLAVTTADNTCQGSCDGTASVSMTGGTPLFTTTWLDNNGNPIGQSGTNASGLCAGDYIVQVDDAAGCIAFANLTIDEPDSLLFSLPNTQEPSCFNTCDGQATAIVIEGTLPYTFLWNDPGAQTTANAINMCAGTFVVTVTDGNGCTTSQTVTINAPAAITIALDSVDASCSTVNDGSIDATVGGGAGGYTYAWTGPNGYTNNTEDISSLFTGMYYLTVTDANGCQLTDSIMVNAILVVNAFAGNDTTVCANSTLFNLTASGGVTYEWYDDSGNLIDTAQVTTVNVPGTTFFVLIAYNGLCTDTDTINITVNPLPQADAGPDIEMVLLATATIGGNPTTSAGNTLYWQPSTYLNDSTLFNPSVTPDTTGTYTYVVTVTDANGCVNTDTMVITVLPSITFPNGFSPNGDGTNDVWEIDYIYLFPDCQVEVYNRWGQLLFLSIGYQTPWDGTYNNQPVPVGTYYYIINLNHPLYPDAYTGPLTVLR